MNKTLKRTIKMLYQYKKLFYFAFVAVILGAILDTLTPRIYSWAIDNYEMLSDFKPLLLFGLLFVSFITVHSFVDYFFMRSCGKLEIKFSRNLRNDIFKKVQRLHLQYFNENQDGWIIARITSDVSKLSEVMSWQFIDSFYFLMLIIFSLISIFFYSVKAGLIVICIYPILLVVLYLIKTKVLKHHRKSRKYNSIIISKFNELISGILTVKTMAIEDNSYEEFRADSMKLRRYSRRAIIYSGFFVPAILVIGYSMVAIVLGVSLNENVVGNMTIGEVAATMTYVLMFIEVTSELTNIVSQLQHAQANAERIFQLLDTDEEICDSEEIEKIYGSVVDELKVKTKVNGDITFENVDFSYKNGEQIYNNFNLKFEQGKSIALVGATGSGKTTLVNLISRFYEPNKGKICIGGTDIKDHSINWLHYNIGHVLQHPFLFSGTVYENIKYNSDVTEERVLEICSELGLNRVLDKLENGIHTDIGEGGSKLSVGEKQLISFARALINDPNIIILDEATSSIDFDSEEIIQSAIYRMMKNRTMIIIAHRLSTIEKCDEILYLKNGQIIERGSHEELLSLKGNYYDLVEIAKVR